MLTLSAIDVGSNGIKMAIGRVHSMDRIETIYTFREPIRLGSDVFVDRRVSATTTRRMIGAFNRFRRIGARHGVKLIKAVATSALREAENGAAVVKKIQKETGVKIDIISGEEEARIVHAAVSHAVNLGSGNAVLVDMGGGSVEVTRVKAGKIVSVQSLNLGAVRLLVTLRGGDSGGEPEYHRLVEEFASAAERSLAPMAGDAPAGVCAGTGGNIEALAALREPLLKKRGSGHITAAELAVIEARLAATTPAERVSWLGLRADRVDVIIPAAIVLKTLMKALRISGMAVPGVGLKDGLLYDAALEYHHKERALNRDDAIASAIRIGRKYFFDEKHAAAVARHSALLFEKTRHLHHLDENNKLLLEAAALLHDIGHYVGVSSHHKHSFYLVSAEPLSWLTPRQKAIVANVARYHRKSFPTARHEPYNALPAPDKMIVRRLAAILRLANAMDAERAAKTSSFHVEHSGNKMLLYLKGKGAMLLEKWALKEKGAMFESEFGVKIAIGKKGDDQA
jgi:exopolyphosphatase/guanosine-5'-triphosphate,3'-diphosphate pyrophosphatase